MLTRSFMGGCSALALVFALASAGSAAAQDQPSQQEEASEVEGLVVTGSYIKGTVESLAIPVQSITTQDLEAQGNPSNLELIKSLPIVGPTFGDANPLGSSRIEGAAGINLRGLSNVRTLVLFNGRRLSPINSGTQQLTDINTLPLAAVSRIEVLKDGGAATYGSDAIAGVVNFITAPNLDGFEASANYSYIEGSDGDLNGKLNWGRTFDQGNLLLSFGFTHRSRLRVTERDWAQPDYLENPTAWSTQTNPGIYSVGNTAATATSFVDPGCEALGGLLTPLPSVGTARNCLHQATAFQNLVDEQNMGQLYGETNWEFSDFLKGHLEGFYSHTRASDVATAASIAPTVFPTTRSTGGPRPGVIPGRFYIPATNPGLIDFLNKYTPAQLGLTQAQYDAARANGVNAGPSWRPFGLGGNPAFGGRETQTHRDFKVFRVSGGFNGALPFAPSIDYDFNLTFGEAQADSPGVDTIVSRMQYALRGLGGEGCDPTTGTPGVGPCQWFNPFSTGTARNAITGAANPNFVGNAPSGELANWFMKGNRTVTTNGTFTAEAIFNGQFEGVDFGAGPVAWAAGVQYRENTVLVEPDDLVNININPCTDEGQPITTCASSPTGIFSIFGPSTPRNYNQETKGIFGELNIPVFEALQVQLAVRHEKHDAGDTTNPKIAVKWQITEELSFRASAGSTYRAPPLAVLDPTIFTTVSQAVGTIRIPFDRTGNPNLRPETAENYNAGLILRTARFRGTIDYWRFKLEDQLIIEDGPSLVNALLPASGPNRCSDPAFADLLARFTFNSSGCGLAANVLRVKVLNVNGPSADLSGVDFSAEWRFEDIYGGWLTFGGDYTYNIDYQVGGIQQFGVTLAQPFDAVGKLNVGVQPLSLPRWRVQLFAEFEKGPHTFRYQVRGADDVFDQRAGSGTASDITAQVPGFPAGTRVLGGVVVDKYWQHDLHYRWTASDDLTLNVSILNLLDEDPPLSRSELSYDAFTASPLGRVIKVGVSKSF